MAEKLTLMAILAHPDDEAFGLGGTLTKYAREGIDVHLVMATLGEAGQQHNPVLGTRGPLSIQREQELRCACASYGITALHLLGYVDGQTTIVPQDQAVYKLVRLLRQYKPQVVISFGPDGVYGHYDHLALHRWSTAAVQLAAEEAWWPQAGSIHTVAKFYHRAMPQEAIAQMENSGGRTAIPIDGIPFPFVGFPLSAITTIINVREYIEAKLSGIRCHASQLDPASPYLQEGFNPWNNPWFWQETFILAHCRGDLAELAERSGKEDDLFAGLR